MEKLVDKMQDMGELTAAKERAVAKFKECVMYSLRGFHTFHVLVGVGVYWDNLEGGFGSNPVPLAKFYSEKASAYH